MKDEKAASVIFERLVEESTLKSRGARTSLAFAVISLNAELARLRTRLKNDQLTPDEAKSIVLVTRDLRETLRSLGLTVDEHKQRRPSLSDLAREMNE